MKNARKKGKKISLIMNYSELRHLPYTYCTYTYTKIRMKMNLNSVRKINTHVRTCGRKNIGILY